MFLLIAQMNAMFNFVMGAARMDAGAVEIAVGRLLAACVHPFTAWRVLPRSDRVLILGAYFAGAFVTTFGALALLLPAL